jgi:hypothetical protein
VSRSGYKDDQTTHAGYEGDHWRWKAAVRKALLSAVTALSIATVSHAGELPDNQTQPAQLHDQNRALAKRVELLEQRLKKLETPRATRPVVAARPAKPPNPASSATADSTRAPSTVADDSLTWHGITLYGAVDMGLAYQTHGAPLSNSAGFGLAYLISKNSNRSYFGAAPNAFSASNTRPAANSLNRVAARGRRSQALLQKRQIRIGGAEILGA